MPYVPVPYTYMYILIPQVLCTWAMLMISYSIDQTCMEHLYCVLRTRTCVHTSTSNYLLRYTYIHVHISYTCVLHTPYYMHTAYSKSVPKAM